MIGKTNGKTRNRAAAMILALTATGLTGCVWDGRQFREAALPMLQTGASAILNGVLDGVFAAIEVESPNE